MYEYKHIEVKKGFIQNRFKGHREIIAEQALQGWRFVTVIPAESRGYGEICSLDLVFERKIDD